jgi:hypothetical protein
MSNAVIRPFRSRDLNPRPIASAANVLLELARFVDDQSQLVAHCRTSATRLEIGIALRWHGVVDASARVDDGGPLHEAVAAIRRAYADLSLSAECRPDLAAAVHLLSRLEASMVNAV